MNGPARFEQQLLASERYRSDALTRKLDSSRDRAVRAEEHDRAAALEDRRDSTIRGCDSEGVETPAERADASSGESLQARPVDPERVSPMFSGTPILTISAGCLTPVPTIQQQ